LEEGLTMTKWHGFEGPIDFLFPDEEDDPLMVILQSVGIYGITKLGQAIGTYQDYRLVYHSASGNMVRREILRHGVRKAGQATIWRGVGIGAFSNPFSAFLVGATMLAYSIPPSGDTWEDVMADNPQWSVNPFTGEPNPYHQD
jgi:hypothetical protein